MITKINEWKKINESKQERKFYTYNWNTYEATISGPDRRGLYHWLVEEQNDAVMPFHESDHAELKTFAQAEKDMFDEINRRIGHLPDSKINESLSKDRANKAKLDMLIQAAREMMEYKEKTKEFAELKKSGNKELEELLDNMEATSIVANGVLVEVIKPYETHRLDTKEYTKFVEDSVDTIGEGYKQMHDKAIEIAKTVKKGFAYTRTAQNKKGLETGTLESLNLFKKFASWIKEQINKFKNFLTSFKNNLFNIKSQALQFQNINEAVYPGRQSKYKNKIVEVLATNKDLSYLELFDKSGFSSKSEDYGLYRNIQLLLEDNIITRFKDGRKYRYNLDTSIDISEIDMTDATSGPVDNAPVVEALEKAKEVINNAEQEKYYKELATIKQKQVMELLKEFGAKKIAIDDKIVSLIEVQESTRIDMEKYQDFMMNVDEVSDNIADMATNLFGLYTKVSKVSGSVRQFADDQNLEDGTLNATFDWVFKAVTKPEDNLNNPKAQVEPVEEGVGSWLKKVWRGIKRFFSNFRISSKRVDIALKNID